MDHLSPPGRGVNIFILRLLVAAVPVFVSSFSVVCDCGFFYVFEGFLPVGVMGAA